MSDFTIFNSYDGTTVSASNGDLVTLHVGGGGLIVVEWLQDFISDTVSNAIPIALNGPITTNQRGSGPGSDGTHWHPIVPFGVTPLTAGQSNVQHAGISFPATYAQASLGFTLIYQDAGTAPSGVPLSLPEDVIDLQVDLLLRTLSSRLLPLASGFKAGDNIKFGIIPKRATTGFIASGITSITLAIRPPAQFTGDPLEFKTQTSLTVSGSGANQYYELAVQLTQDALTRWFSNANAAQFGGVSGGPAVDQINAIAELQFAESTVITTSATFIIPLLQSIATPSP